MKRIILIPAITLYVASGYAQSSIPIQKEKNSTPVKSISTAATSKLSGVFNAPPGISIVLQNNGKNDLAISSKKEVGKIVSRTPFAFPTSLTNGSKFKIGAKSFTAGQTIYIHPGADGEMPQSYEVKISSDYTYDLLTRGTNDATFSTFYESSNPVVGGSAGEEGRYVAYISSASNFAGNSGKHRQIFWRDRNTGITKLISATPTGEEGNGDCYAPAISGDGRSVAFESVATNLTGADKNGVKDIFIWHSVTDKIEIVSTGNDGKEANANSYEASVSADGNFVAFTSDASNISATPKGGSSNNFFAGHAVEYNRYDQY